MRGEELTQPSPCTSETFEYIVSWKRWASEASSCTSFGTTLADCGPVALEADRFNLHGNAHGAIDILLSLVRLRLCLVDQALEDAAWCQRWDEISVT